MPNPLTDEEIAEIEAAMIELREAEKTSASTEELTPKSRFRRLRRPPNILVLWAVGAIALITVTWNWNLPGALICPLQIGP